MIKLFILAKRRILSSARYAICRMLKRPVKPLFINFIVTYMCNSRCIMCDIWKKYSTNSKKYHKTPVDELTVCDIEHFVKRDKEFLSDLKSIGFTGGEAFLRNDIVDILKVVHRHLPWADLGVQTNGLLPELIRAKIKDILKFYPHFKIAVSLDGIGDIHDEVRGVKGAYDKAIATIRYAQELGITGITCGMTLTTGNFDKIKEVAATVESLGCEFSCFLAENSEYFGNVGKENRLSRKQLDIIAEQLKDFNYHYFMDNLRLQIAGKRRRSLPCYSGYTSYVIDPYGNVHPCILRNESFGNIKDKPLKSIISQDGAWGLREKLQGCTCWCECEVSSSAVTVPLDVMRWLIKSRNKAAILRSLNKKTLLKRL